MKNLFQNIKFSILAAALGLCLLPARSEAQMFSLFTQYTDIQTFVNPGALPADFLQYQQRSVASLNFRSQYLKIEGAPVTGLARFDHTKEGNNLYTFGGAVVLDQIGAMSTRGIYGRYAYQIRPSVQEDMFIGIGLMAGMVQQSIDNSALEFLPDDQLQAARVSKWIPDFGIGVNFIAYPQRGMKFYAGLSVPQVAGLAAKFESRSGDEFLVERPLHFLGTLGFIIPSGQQGFIEPSLWIKQTKGQPINADFNFRVKLKNNFWAGAGYNTAQAIHLDVGTILTEAIGLPEGLVRVGYGFDYNIRPYGVYLGTTHEFNINYAFGSTRR